MAVKLTARPAVINTDALTHRENHPTDPPAVKLRQASGFSRPKSTSQASRREPRPGFTPGGLGRALWPAEAGRLTQLDGRRISWVIFPMRKRVGVDHRRSRCQLDRHVRAGITFVCL